MARVVTKLSFVIVETASKKGGVQYVLQFNHHLNGYNFFGGHVEEGEDPGEAALRELREELGHEELMARWNIGLRGDVPEKEWRKTAQSLKTIKGPSAGEFRVPFYSVRAQREGQPPEKTARLSLFRLQINPKLCPTLFKRIQFLSEKQATYGGSNFSGKVCQFFTASELIEEAWRNLANPFLRFAIKKGVIGMNPAQTLALPYVLNLPALESFLQERLESILCHVLRLDSGEALDVQIIPPAESEPRVCLQTNSSLKARLELRWTGSDKVFRIEFPWPESGVFILRSNNSTRAGRWIWHPRLVSQPGLWVIRKHRFEKGERQTSDWLHLGLPGRKYLELPLDDDEREKRLQKWKEESPVPEFLLLPGVLGDQVEGQTRLLRQIESKFPGAFICHEQERESFFTALGEAAKKASPQRAVDEQDIGYQRLYTYSAYLVETILETVLHRLILGLKDQSLAQRVRECLRGTGNVDGDSAQQVWLQLCEAAYRVERRISRAFARRKEDEYTGWVHYFDPTNGIDALSRLTSFQRYPYGSEALEFLPALDRQNHPSFRGVVCSVESPETKKVGITLHLARGVRSDILGRLFPASKDAKDRDLGYAASLVPFYQHNDGARSMMGAKNLKQAVPIKGESPPAIATDREREIQQLVQPLVSAGISEACSYTAPGVDLLVAYMPWYGWNFEDAIVANKRLVDERILDWEMTEEHFAYILPGFELTEPPAGTSLQEAMRKVMFDINHLHKCGRMVTPESEIAFFRDPNSNKIYPVRCGGDGPGELVEVAYTPPPSPLLGGSLSWRVRRRRPLMVGDKLMGRYGNKGVVSVILPPEKLPRLPDDPRLPEDLRGRAVDLLLNPHGVISRMNLGQLLETHLGLLARLRPSALSADIGRAFKNVDLGKIRKLLGSINDKGDQLIDEYGRMYLTLPDGKKTEAPVTVGFQHFVRLKHMAVDKAQVRPPAGPQSKYPYNLITGQPVGGRRRRGGQRVGEMEVWALAAHQAHENLASILGRKSDPSWSPRGPYQSQTFNAIRDHLFAMGIAVSDANGGLKLDWAAPEIIKRRGKPVSRSETWSIAVKGRFYCSAENCKYQYPKLITATGKSQRGQLRLTVKDVLAHQGYDFPSDINKVIQKSKAGTLKVTLLPKCAGKKKKSLSLKFDYKGELKLCFTLGGRKFSAYRQVGSKVVSLTEVAEMHLTCPNHTTRFLACEAKDIVPDPVKGGLCDPDVFGGIDLRTRYNEGWGYIELPFPVEYPRDEKRIKIGEDDNPPQLTYIPVLPLKYRYQKPLRFGIDAVPWPEALTDYYADLIESIRSYRAGGKEKKARAGISGAIRALFQEIYSRLFGKYGLIRRHGLGRRVDASGRLVIVPDPTLKWYECGVPTEVLIALLGNRIIDNPILYEFVPDKTIDNLIRALFGVEISYPEFSQEVRSLVLSERFWSEFEFNYPNREFQRECLTLAQCILERYLEEHPHITVILNRQPSLHRYNMMGFHPVPLSPDEGLVLKIHPLVCKGFAADFDGDEMAIHMPLTDEEHKEAERLKPTQPWNLMSLADGSPVASLDQDFVLGHFLISRDKDAKQRFHDLLLKYPNIKRCRSCSKHLEARAPWDRNKADALLRHLCECHAQEAAEIVPAWMHLAFEMVTVKGISFGFLELEKLRREIEGKVEKIVKQVTGSSKIAKKGAKQSEDELQKVTKQLEEITINYLQDLEGEHWRDLKHPGYSFAAMAVSGARGKKQQIRQLIAARGYLAPGDVGFEDSPCRFFIPESLVAGMTRESAFWAAMNARSSMIDKKLATPKAGDLTRRLVLAAWPWHVRCGDCRARTKLRTLLSCQWIERKAICSTCYGKVTGYDQLPDGYPAGLIAAQSFGERGTQLSMQSFHTGERQLSIDAVISLLNGRDPMPGNGEKAGYNWFEKDSDALAFVKRIRREKAYEKLDERHLLLIWLIIHRSEDKTLSGAWQNNATPLSSLVGPGQWSALLKNLRKASTDDLSSPFVKVILGQAPILAR